MLAGVAIVLFQFLSSASLYFCNADEVGVKSELHGGSSVSACRARSAASTSPCRDSGILAFTLTFNDATVPVRYQGGEPSDLFQAGRAAVVEGRLEDGTFAADRILVKHDSEYKAENPDRVAWRRAVMAAARDRSTPVNGALGMAGIALGLAASVLGGVTLVSAWCSTGRAWCAAASVYVWLVLGGAVLAVVAMERALITRDFSLSYVAEVGLVAHAGALQRGQPVELARRLDPAVDADPGALRRGRPGCGSAVACSAIPSSRGRSSCCSSSRPSSSSSWPVRPTRSAAVSGAVPLDGPGPNPLLQNHPLMVVHPPMLYLGYVGFSVPFAFAIGGLITGRVGEGWLLDTRRWTLFAWGFLSVGIVLGAWWSYEVLGWGGVWGWDPVENASLLPWLTGTAFIHSVLVQERRGMLRVWNLSLLAATFCLTILGTFLTRSGVLESVHAFSDGPIGVYLLDVLRPGRRHVDRAHRLAGRPAALAGHDRLAAVARGGLPGQQRAVRAVRLRGAAGHRLPARGGGAAGSAALGRSAVLRPDDHAARPGPAHADGDRPGPAVAQGVRRAPAPPALLARLPGRRLRRRARCCSAPTDWRRCWPSGWVGSRPARRCANSCWPPVARVGGGWSAEPTAA